MNFTTRYCSELKSVESTNYRIIFQDSIYDIEYVDPMGFKRNSLKFKTALRKR